MQAAVDESDIGAGDEITQRSRDQDLAGSGGRNDARADVHTYPGDPTTVHFAFADMEPCAGLEPECPHRRDGGAREANGGAGRTERCEKTIARGVDLPPAIPPDVAPDR